MENQEIIITITILAVLAYFYWQNRQESLNTLSPENDTKLKELKNQVQHYQKLYQDRVKKDLAGNQTQEIQQLNQQLEQTSQDYQEINEELIQIKEYNQLYQQKITDLENSLLNLAKQKLKGKKEAEKLLTDLETNWQQKQTQWEEKIQGLKNQLTHQQNLVANKDNFIKTLETNLSQNKQQLEKNNQELSIELKKNQELTAKCQEINQLEQARLTLEAEATHLQQEIKELAQKNEKLTEDYNQTQTTYLGQLRKINVLFDDQATNYERIDFNGLYSLLEQVAERKKENEQLNQEIKDLDKKLEIAFKKNSENEIILELEGEIEIPEADKEIFLQIEADITFHDKKVSVILLPLPLGLREPSHYRTLYEENHGHDRTYELCIKDSTLFIYSEEKDEYQATRNSLILLSKWDLKKVREDVSGRKTFQDWLQDGKLTPGQHYILSNPLPPSREKQKEPFLYQNKLNLSKTFSLKKLLEIYQQYEKYDDGKDWNKIHSVFGCNNKYGWINNDFTYEQTKKWIDVGLKPDDYNFAEWLRDTKKVDEEWFSNEGDYEKLREEYGDSLMLPL